DDPHTRHAAHRAARWLAPITPQPADPATPPRTQPGHDLEATAERALHALVHAQAPPPSVAAVLATLLHAGATERTHTWNALLQEPSHSASPTIEAVLTAVAAVVSLRTGAHDRAARQAAHALRLLPPETWGVAVGMPLAAAVLAATRLGRHSEAAQRLRLPVPDAMFHTPAGPHYLLARGHHHLATGRPRAALNDFHTCRDLLQQRPPAGPAPDWQTGAAEAFRAHGETADPARDPIAALTRAERRVAVLAAHGCTNRSIAARLYVTPSTVEQHLTHIYRKLSLTSRRQLSGLVTEPRA
ncbi:helix-turn-helix transcriptional regulator, partial [Streptomyces solincola]